jgi:hypothetical protein
VKALLVLLLLALAAPAGARIHRSPAAVRAFRHSHPCPATARTAGACPGYVVDHRCPLACGGADAPGNMGWQRADEAKIKDRWERTPRGCAALCGVNP